MQKKLVRIITCSQTSPYWTIDACHQNVISDINRYLTDTFVFQCIHKKAPEMFLNLFHTNCNFHDHGTRHSEDPHVPYGRIDVRQFSIKIHGANCGIPYQIKWKVLSLFIWSSNNFATIWLNHGSSAITISSMWIIIFYITVPIDESCIVLVSCWSLVSNSSDLEIKWNPSESINWRTILKCTFLLTPVLLLITLVNGEVITYLQ